jgi:ABC-type Fe3+/spermidine/putrescine transport system ATPase subunit
VVTHDQREAFSLADRIAVMEAGRIAQIGSPEEVYHDPNTTSVFRFLGTINQFRAQLREQGGIRMLRVADGFMFESPFPPEHHCDGKDVSFGIRAEDIALSETPTPVHSTGPALVKLRTFLGAQERIVLDLGGRQIIVDRTAQMGGRPIDRDQKLYIDFDPRRCRLAPLPE